jgi:hypothetical protein
MPDSPVFWHQVLLIVVYISDAELHNFYEAPTAPVPAATLQYSKVNKFLCTKV